jgi:hypothetical protein
LTLPAHVSMLTGLLPFEHGVRNNVGYLYDAAKHPPITAALRTAGYEQRGWFRRTCCGGNTG